MTEERASRAAGGGPAEESGEGADWSGYVTARSGYRLFAERFGPEDGPGLLMVMGGNAPCFVFPDRLCRGLADRGYRVVRYDHRGAGRSSPVAYPQDAYRLGDLAEDAADVVRGLHLGPALVFGISTGGAVAQLLALEHGALVRELVLMSTSPDYNVDPSRPPETGLPLPGPEWTSLVARMSARPPLEHDDVVRDLLEGWQLCVGPAMPFEEAYWRDVAERTLRLPQNRAPGVHQGPAVDAAPPRTGRLADVRVPALVIHGGHDAVLPPAHGRALAGAIPGARLVELPALGHMFPYAFCDELGALIAGEGVPQGG